ncbi:hypothetical protein [Flammeovirga sp. SJP92]|uniref:hypothetical protein n=1 Tax=Flammeovirga sp. SJP92 TaxID=1775430 RepID=UPI000AAB1D75|nr:hypothetical protein [Flammeovirga sp. SJP92]
MKRKQQIVFTIILWVGTHLMAFAQEAMLFPVPDNLPESYPRIFTAQTNKKELQQKIKKEQWAQELLSDLHDRIDVHVERHVNDPEWMVSRLQMNWKTKASNVYVNGINYSHSDGEAPVPTVKFDGSRNSTTVYGRPKLEDILPYMDDERGMYLPNRSKEGHPFEWTDRSETGTIISSINNEILKLGKESAFLYWLEGDVRYAQFAFDLFDVYMTGMSYRKEPIDLLNGHIQTLVGFSHFQVIHERSLETVSILYDFLHHYIENQSADKVELYDATLKRWMDQVIKNGVPQNNWNLHQANIILKATMVLGDDDDYEDQKGRQYYINYILNVTSTRQWSLSKFMNYGYDAENGIWNECPGYAQGVTKTLMEFITNFDNAFNVNLLPYAPVMEKAIKVLPQYTFPNGQTVGFGDTYYGPLETEAIENVIRLAQKYKNDLQEKEYTALLYSLSPDYGLHKSKRKHKTDISSFFSAQPLVLNPKYKQGDLEEYITPTFYAPNVSWHVQRIGKGTDGLMASLNASLGNHMHANGINLELYGKGFVQGADPGKGAGYLDPIYLEYYSQFPAHNTVMVDGISSYTEMLSNHAFDLLNEFPTSEQQNEYAPNVTFSNVYFLEPESRSDQNRLVSIIKTGETMGYYIDIFRSKKQKGGDKFHDYYYHNLGQSIKVMNSKNESLTLEPNDDFGFAGGHLYALDYIWNKQSIRTNKDYQVEWKIDFPQGKDDVFMNLWMKGTEGREVFTMDSPPCKSFRKKSGIPYEVSKAPYRTMVARQYGEAWNKPFVSVFEPFTSKEGKQIKTIQGIKNIPDTAVGLKIEHKSGRKDYVFSSYEGQLIKAEGHTTDAEYALIGEEKNGDLILVTGNGTKLNSNEFSIKTKSKGNFVLEVKNQVITLHNNVGITIGHKGKEYYFQPDQARVIQFE